MKKCLIYTALTLILGCQNFIKSSKEDIILGEWYYQSHKIDEESTEAIKFQEKIGKGVKSLSYTFYEDKTYHTEAKIFNDGYSHSGTYRFKDKSIVLHSTSENLDRTSQIILLQKDIFIIKDDLGVELTFKREKK